MAVAPQAAREMQLWGWPQQMMAGQAQMPESWVQQNQQGRPVIMQPNSGNFQYIPTPHANKDGENTKSKMQKLWMFNMGYEHHEQVHLREIHAGRQRNREGECVRSCS
jgi:hypothetical protein